MLWFTRNSNDTQRKCRHRRSWIISYAHGDPATEAVTYTKYRQCRRCGVHLEQVY